MIGGGNEVGGGALILTRDMMQAAIERHITRMEKEKEEPAVRRTVLSLPHWRIVPEGEGKEGVAADLRRFLSSQSWSAPLLPLALCHSCHGSGKRWYHAPVLANMGEEEYRLAGDDRVLKALGRLPLWPPEWKTCEQCAGEGVLLSARQRTSFAISTEMETY